MDNVFAAVTFKTPSIELLSLWLEPYGVLSIEETENYCVGYWNWSDWQNVRSDIESQTEVEELFSIESVEEIQQQNWNQKWEENFQPIEVDSFCRIRAPFHPPKNGFEYEMLIEPKMSFGTGHHATTWQMIKMMSEIDFHNQSVLDYGCGTGILAILAARMGASLVKGFDYDEWCYHNALDNAQLNEVDSVAWSVDTLDTLDKNQLYSIILANINRNVLLESVDGLASIAQKNALLLVSGFYVEDLPVVEEAYQSAFTLSKYTERENWCCALLTKK